MNFFSVMFQKRNLKKKQVSRQSCLSRVMGHHAPNGGCCDQGWAQVKYLYLVLDAKIWVLGTYLYLTPWNSKVLGTYLYLKAKYLILVQVLSSTFVRLRCIFRLKFGICFLQQVTTKHHDHELLKWSILCASSMGSPDIKIGLPLLICRLRIP